MGRIFKFTLVFVFTIFLIGIIVEYITDKNFTTAFFVKKTISTLIGGLIYFGGMYYFSKKSK